MVLDLEAPGHDLEAVVGIGA